MDLKRPEDAAFPSVLDGIGAPPVLAIATGVIEGGHMHFSRIATAVVAASLVSACATTHGGDTPIKVEANDFHAISMMVWHPSTCAAGALAEVRVTEEPKHGEIIVTKLPLTQDNPSKTCFNKDILARVIVYKPNKDYRGPDSFAIKYSRQLDDRDMRKGWSSDRFEVIVE